MPSDTFSCLGKGDFILGQWHIKGGGHWVNPVPPPPRSVENILTFDMVSFKERGPCAYPVPQQTKVYRHFVHAPPHKFRVGAPHHVGRGSGGPQATTS